MTRYVLQRLLGILPTLLLLVFAIVLFGRLAPGDAVDTILAEAARDKQSRDQVEKELGLDRSLPEIYIDYIAGLTRGDLGRSYLTRKDVRASIFQRVNVTLELAVFALIVGWSLGAVIGVISAVAQDGPLDYILRSISILGLTVPNFAIATAVIVLPAIYWGRPPPVVYQPFGADPVAHLQQFILPVVCLAFALTGGIMRIMRTQMLEVLRQDYIRTARVKGLSEKRVIYSHALRNALIPVISVFGLQMAGVVSGSVILESIFSLPGMGSLLINAVNTKDWPVVQGITVVVSLWVMLVNLVIDLSYGFIDPRIKVGRAN